MTAPRSRFVPTVGWPQPDSSGLLFAFRRRELLVWDDFTLPRGRTFQALGLDPVRVQLIGHLDGEPCFSAELAPAAQPPEGAHFRGLRELYARLEPALVEVAARAVQITDWDRTHLYCGACGAPTTPDLKSRSRLCAACDASHYPRLSPAVIVAVERGREILLGHAPHHPAALYTTLAGFVEPGESAEDAVHREVFEEVGIRITNLRYFGSQAWPFPHSLMIAFQADYAEGAIAVDPEEIEHAAFFPVDAMPQLFPGRVSIAQWLIHDFLGRYS